MKIISTLIVENHEDSRSTIKRGIRKYNERSTEYKIEVIGEAESFEKSMAIIRSFADPIHLIFLDLTLDTEKSGLDLSKELSNSNIGFIIVSKDPLAGRKFTNTTNARKIYDIGKEITMETESKNEVQQYIERASEGSFDSDDIVLAVEKFIGAKGNELYDIVVKLGTKAIIANDIAFISNTPLLVDKDRQGRRFIADCTVCMRTRKPKHDHNSLYVSSNMIDTSLNHGCLRQLYDVNGKTLTSMMESHDWNPNHFVRISPSLVANLLYVSLCDKHTLYFKLSDSASAMYKSDARYITPDVLRKIAAVRAAGL